MTQFECVASEVIKLSLINDRVMTFNHDDYMTIRRKFRIVGKLIGVPVSKPRNTQWHGLPAVYSEFEVKLLVEKNLVMIEDKSVLRDEPSDEIRQSYRQFIDETNAEVQKNYIESRLEATKAQMDRIIRGKRLKLLKSGVAEVEIRISPDDILSKESERLQKSSTNLATQIPNEFPFPLQITSENVGEIPVLDLRKFLVFRDLWERNFFVTNGDSFGCDFLTYRGDPTKFHASHTVHVIDPETRFNVKYLISCARLSISVNKKCVFAYLDSNDQVEYQTLEWDNPKLREQFQPSSSSQCVETKNL